MTDLILHELPPSPNSFKVRAALGYKGLEWTSKPLDLSGGVPGDRSELIELSGQPRLPILVHGETRIFDSSAILRYLEANFPDTPPLFVKDYALFSKLEEWESFGRSSELNAAIGMVFQQAFAPAPDSAVIQEANARFHDATAKLESQLAEGPYLVTDHPTAADIVCAAVTRLGTLDESATPEGSILRFFATHLSLGEGREKTADWVSRIATFDR